MTNDGSISPFSIRSSSGLHVAVHVGLAHLERQALGERRRRSGTCRASRRRRPGSRRCRPCGRPGSPGAGRGPVGLQHQRRLGAVVARRRASWPCASRPTASMQASGPAAAGHLLQRLVDVDLLVVERRRPCPGSRHAQPLGEAVDGDDALGAEQRRRSRWRTGRPGRSPRRRRCRRAGCRSSPRPCSRSGRCRRGTAPARRAGRSGTLSGPDVGERHAHVLGLAAGVAAEHVRVAEEPRAASSRTPSRPARRWGWSCRRATRAASCRRSSGRRRS